jgi:sugar phosphate isomerase/epimerase
MLRAACLLSVLCLTTAAMAADPAPRQDAASEQLGLKLGLQCWTYNRLTTFEAIERAQKLGIKYLEMYPGQKLRPDSEAKNGPGLSAEDQAALVKKLADCGVKAVSFGVDGLPGDEAGLRVRLAWAKAMGLENYVTETKPTELMSKLADEYGINICIHNHPKTWPADQVLAAVKELGPRVGACGDSGHWLRAGKVPVENLQLLAGRMREMHFKDLNEKNEDVVYGTGRGDVAGQLAELKKQGFKGYLIIEYERGDLAHLDATLPQCVAAFDKLCADLAK